MNLRKALALGSAFAVAAICTPVLMASRNSGGTYSLPAGNPVVSGTTITSTYANTTNSDIATELTNSLDRNGRGAMLAPLQLYSGSSSAPGLSFSSETNSGLYRAGSNDIRMQVNATNVQKWSATGSTFPLTLGVTGATTLSGATTLAALATFSGTTGLPAAAGGGNLYIGGGFSTPVTGRIYVGDGSGWRLSFAKRTGSTDTELAGIDDSGRLLFYGSNPASTTGFTNALTPKNVPKAWGRTTGGTGQTIVGGFNVASTSCATSKVTVTFGTAMADANYMVSLSRVTGGTQCAPELFSTSAGSFVVACRDSASSLVDMCASGNAPFSFSVFGAQ